MSVSPIGVSYAYATFAIHKFCVLCPSQALADISFPSIKLITCACLPATHVSANESIPSRHPFLISSSFSWGWVNDVALKITLLTEVRKALILLVGLCLHTLKMRYKIKIISIAVPSQLPALRANALPAVPLLAGTDAPDEGG